MLSISIIACVVFIACKPKTEDVSTTLPETTTLETPVANQPSVNEWMSWEGGMDVSAITDTSFKMPNVIVHVARMVSTPVGNCSQWHDIISAGYYQSHLLSWDFVSTNKTVGAYFGPKIFAGTPFEKAPVLDATFDIQYTDKRVLLQNCG